MWGTWDQFRSRWHGGGCSHISAIHTLRVYINVPQQFSPAAKTGLIATLTLQEFPGRKFTRKTHSNCECH